MKSVFTCFLLFLGSCITEKNTITEGWFINTTQHYIDVRVYSQGQINLEASFALAPLESKRQYTENERGKTPGMSYGLRNYLNDSFVVIFDDQFALTHYKQNLPGNNPKSYPAQSLRNLYNDSSYEKIIEQESKNGRSWRFNYYFRESDFLDAQ
jgi:hypothetical protein